MNVNPEHIDRPARVRPTTDERRAFFDRHQEAKTAREARTAKQRDEIIAAYQKEQQQQGSTQQPEQKEEAKHEQQQNNDGKMPEQPKSLPAGSKREQLKREPDIPPAGRARGFHRGRG